MITNTAIFYIKSRVKTEQAFVYIRHLQAMSSRYAIASYVKLCQAMSSYIKLCLI